MGNKMGKCKQMGIFLAFLAFLTILKKRKILSIHTFSDGTKSVLEKNLNAPYNWADRRMDTPFYRDTRTQGRKNTEQVPREYNDASSSGGRTDGRTYLLGRFKTLSL